MNELILTTLSPILVQILAAILAAAFAGTGTMVLAAVRKYFGLKAEAIMRDVLHQALNTGVDLAADSGSPAAVATAAIAYARQSVPDAIAKLGASDGVLTQLALAKVKSRIN